MSYKEYKDYRIKTAKENENIVAKNSLPLNIHKPLEYNLNDLSKLESLNKNKKGNISFFQGTTNNVIHHIYDKYKLNCTVMNFANSKHAGGGYMHGALAQEEELCRTIIDLYPSLLLLCDKATRYGRKFNWRTDVKYNLDLNLHRLDTTESDGYYNFAENKKVSVITLAAPNLHHDEYELQEYMKDEMKYLAIIKNVIKLACITPILSNDTNKILVLGAIGCGAFAPDPKVIPNYPKKIASLFYEILIDEGISKLYDNIYFAIPKGYNYDAFSKVFIKK